MLGAGLVLFPGRRSLHGGRRGHGAIHAFLTITIRVNQIVSGLAITIFAGIIGLSSYLGESGTSAGSPAVTSSTRSTCSGSRTCPSSGPLIFNQDVFVYASWVLVVGVLYYLYRTRPGLYLRAVGENPAAADAMGINVTAYRYTHTLIGGALAGLGGAYFTLDLAPIWTDGLTAGVGWIAIALVIFAFWRPELLVLGAYLFGIFSALGPTLQTHHITALPSEFYSALPFLMTVVALAAASTSWANRRIGTPASLGVPYTPRNRPEGAAPGAATARTLAVARGNPPADMVIKGGRVFVPGTARMGIGPTWPWSTG